MSLGAQISNAQAISYISKEFYIEPMEMHIIKICLKLDKKLCVSQEKELPFKSFDEKEIFKLLV